jgi:hypothetical protein
MEYPGKFPVAREKKGVLVVPGDDIDLAALQGKALEHC